MITSISTLQHQRTNAAAAERVFSPHTKNPVPPAIGADERIAGSLVQSHRSHMHSGCGTSEFSQSAFHLEDLRLQVIDRNTSSAASECSCSDISTALSKIDISQLHSAIDAVLIPDAQGRIHEEEFQYALVSFLLEQKSPEAAEHYRNAFAQILAEADLPSGVEDAVKLALKTVVQAGLVARDEAESINGISFAAAQLDDNKEALYDNRGSSGDPTIAVLALDEAVVRGQCALHDILTGKQPFEVRSLDAPSNTAPSSTPGIGNEGFLWKPVSESDGNLVVLLPAAITDEVLSAAIHSDLPPSSATLIEEGQFTGSSHNGGRAHYRFDKPGSEYPTHVFVVAALKNGGYKSFRIDDTSQRNEG